MSRRLLVWSSVGSVVLVAAISVVVFVLVSGNEPRVQQSKESTTTTTVPDTSPNEPEFDSQRARELEAALVSRDPSKVKEVVVADDTTVGELTSSAVPQGAVLRIDEASVTVESDGSASVSSEVELADGSVFSATLFLVELDGEWRIVGSDEPVEAE